MKLSPISETRIVNICWFLGGFVIGLSAMYVSIWFGPGLFAYALLIHRWFVSIKCPQCEKPVGWNPIRICGVTLLEWWTPWVPKKCRKCGTDLSLKKA